MRGRAREREPIGGPPQLRSLPARAFASKRFYGPTKYLPVLPTTETPTPLRCAWDGAHGQDYYWLRREDEYVRDLRLHGSATHTRAENEVGVRESPLKESHK